MNFAEKKVALLKLLVEADEETTGKIFDFARQLKPDSEFSAEELAKFHATREKYLSSDTKTILMEDAHAYIRSLKQK
jgi:hypothetical protein